MSGLPNAGGFDIQKDQFSPNQSAILVNQDRPPKFGDVEMGISGQAPQRVGVIPGYTAVDDRNHGRDHSVQAPVTRDLTHVGGPTQSVHNLPPTTPHNGDPYGPISATGHNEAKSNQRKVACPARAVAANLPQLLREPANYVRPVPPFSCPMPTNLRAMIDAIYDPPANARRINKNLELPGFKWLAGNFPGILNKGNHHLPAHSSIVREITGAEGVPIPSESFGLSPDLFKFLWEPNAPYPWMNQDPDPNLLLPGGYVCDEKFTGTAHRGTVLRCTGYAHNQVGGTPIDVCSAHHAQYRRHFSAEQRDVDKNGVFFPFCEMCSMQADLQFLGCRCNCDWKCYPCWIQELDAMMIAKGVFQQMYGGNNCPSCRVRFDGVFQKGNVKWCANCLMFETN